MRRSPGGSYWALAQRATDIDADALEEAATEPLFGGERVNGWLGTLRKGLANLLREHGLPLPRATLAAAR